MSKSIITSFGKQFVAMLAGDNTEVLAEKNFRVAVSGLKSRINNLEGETVELEDAVEDAKRAQAEARVNGAKKIEDKGAYVEGLIEAQNRVEEAEQNLADHLELIEFLKNELAVISEEVPA